MLNKWTIYLCLWARVLNLFLGAVDVEGFSTSAFLFTDTGLGGFYCDGTAALLFEALGLGDFAWDCFGATSLFAALGFGDFGWDCFGDLTSTTSLFADLKDCNLSPRTKSPELSLRLVDDVVGGSTMVRSLLDTGISVLRRLSFAFFDLSSAKKKKGKRHVWIKQLVKSWNKQTKAITQRHW